MSGSSDEFSGRLGLIFATIGAAIGTGNIWRFPRMVGANGGGPFLVPWLIFLFLWSTLLVIAEFAMGKRSRTGTVGMFRIFNGPKFAWMGLDRMDFNRDRVLLCRCHRVVYQLLPDRTPRRPGIGRRYHRGLEQLPQAPGEVACSKH